METVVRALPRATVPIDRAALAGFVTLRTETLEQCRRAGGARLVFGQCPGEQLGQAGVGWRLVLGDRTGVAVSEGRAEIGGAAAVVIGRQPVQPPGVQRFEWGGQP